MSVIAENKMCSRCNTLKSPADFYKNRKGKGGLTSYCRSCQSQVNAEMRASLSPEEKAKRDKYLRDFVIKRKYNLTPEQWESLFDEQGRACAICKTTECRTQNGWNVDHCHSTGEVRGILCQHCNQLLGMAQDKTQILIDATFYLLKYQHQ